MDINSNTDAKLLALLEKDIKELRKLAASVYRLAVTKDMDKADIAKLILEKEKKTTFAKIVDGRSANVPAPGYARIFVHKDQRPGESNRPIYWSINGRRFCVPRGIKVDVPIKLVDGPMKDNLERRLVEDESEAINSVNRWKWELMPTYPYYEEMRTEGPDPFPGDEVARGAKRQIELDFLGQYGYYPKTDELKQYMIQRANEAGKK